MIQNMWLTKGKKKIFMAQLSNTKINRFTSVKSVTYINCIITFLLKHIPNNYRNEIVSIFVRFILFSSYSFVEVLYAVISSMSHFLIINL